MTLDLQSVARAMGAEWGGPPQTVCGWSVDTRTQNPRDVYFALRGPNHDGHDFVHAALEKCAAAVVVERPGLPCAIQVPDTLLALQQLATWARRSWGGQVIGVTGSAGKTTTKDAIAHLLSTELAVGKTIGNLNNHVGVPLSILRLPNEARAAVLEMGMNHAGEIRDLAAIARPDIGVVTNVGYAHVEFFDSIEGVAAAKRELIEGLPPAGVAVLNADDPRVAQFAQAHTGRSVTFGFSDTADIRAEAADLHADGASFHVRGVPFETAMVGRHAVMNLLAAIAVADVFGIALERLPDAVRTFSAGKMRGERIDHRGIVVWNDCYNSNPEAAQSMIDVLEETSAAKRIAVLGEMLELGSAGDELHRRVGRYAAGHGVDVLIGVRGAARAMVEAAEAAGLRSVYFDDPAEAGEFVRSEAGPGDAVLFKGSRGVRVERALERFLA
ncbi:MAG TPA: UDP-N-acetylmuramoyl-tripeptide--D-alanyl-D-alanine ligase [Candidatus Acidoferrum sp.]|nr:UDP-N-acetylmuramoyl-tripeptide--D-alanyl-D-alanine ligase [Candidatus Acidoferrum sp.]